MTSPGQQDAARDLPFTKDSHKPVAPGPIEAGPGNPIFQKEFNALRELKSKPDWFGKRLMGPVMLGFT